MMYGLIGRIKDHGKISKYILIDKNGNSKTYSFKEMFRYVKNGQVVNLGKNGESIIAKNMYMRDIPLYNDKGSQISGMSENHILEVVHKLLYDTDKQSDKQTDKQLSNSKEHKKEDISTYIKSNNTITEQTHKENNITQKIIIINQRIKEVETLINSLKLRVCNLVYEDIPEITDEIYNLKELVQEIEKQGEEDLHEIQNTEKYNLFKIKIGELKNSIRDISLKINTFRVKRIMRKTAETTKKVVKKTVEVTKKVVVKAVKFTYNTAKTAVKATINGVKSLAHLIKALIFK